MQQGAHIKHATELEQQLMEGAYNKVLSSKSNVPDKSYLYFMDKLISTVRHAQLLSCDITLFLMLWYAVYSMVLQGVTCYVHFIWLTVCVNKPLHT